MTLQTPRLLAPEDGEHWAFLNTNMTIKADGRATGGTMTVIEALMPAGFGPPPHRHDVEDELFFILEGELFLECAGQSATYGPGGCAYLPKGLPHRFQVSDDGPARMLQISTPAQFDDFVRALGQPAEGFVLPEPSEPDLGELVRVASEFQIEILAPAPVEPTA